MTFEGLSSYRFLFALLVGKIWCLWHEEVNGSCKEIFFFHLGGGVRDKKRFAMERKDMISFWWVKSDNSNRLGNASWLNRQNIQWLWAAILGNEKISELQYSNMIGMQLCSAVC